MTAAALISLFETTSTWLPIHFRTQNSKKKNQHNLQVYIDSFITIITCTCTWYLHLCVFNVRQAFVLHFRPWSTAERPWLKAFPHQGLLRCACSFGQWALFNAARRTQQALVKRPLELVVVIVVVVVYTSYTFLLAIRHIEMSFFEAVTRKSS